MYTCEYCSNLCIQWFNHCHVLETAVVCLILRALLQILVLSTLDIWLSYVTLYACNYQSKRKVIADKEKMVEHDNEVYYDADLEVETPQNNIDNTKNTKLNQVWVHFINNHSSHTLIIIYSIQLILKQRWSTVFENILFILLMTCHLQYKFGCMGQLKIVLNWCVAIFSIPLHPYSIVCTDDFAHQSKLTKTAIFFTLELNW